MKSCPKRCLASFLFFLFIYSSSAQDQRAFNQNASRSNHTRLSFSLTPTYSIATNSSSDSLLFRGNGAGFRLGADYYFGAAGISFSSGFGSAEADDATINNFLKRFPIPASELVISKARQQNMYLLLGPTVRFGKGVEVNARAQAGLFINNSGLVSIQQKGALRAAYRVEASEKSIYPGFLAGAGIQYQTNSDWSFGVSIDYMGTKSEVNNYDVRRGGGMEALKLSRNISDVVTGITIRYNISSPRDHSSGQATGRRSYQPGQPVYGNITSREAGSGMATGRRSYQPGQPVYGNITAVESCGSVTQKVTHPDGSTEEMTFACPADAADYATRKGSNTTVPKQTQGATFGEKVNAGLHQAAGVVAQGSAARNIISGKLTWASAGSTGIVTNRSIGRGGSATMNSQTSATRQTQQNSFGSLVRLSAREAGSGMATGKRSREAGSGLATGRRQHEPFFIEGEGDVCNPCQVTAKMSGAKSNPLYNDKGRGGDNPLFQGKMAGTTDDDCDGIAGIHVSLVIPGSGVAVAQTTTGQCGDFFFANVPDGNYIVKLSGRFTGSKAYDVAVSSKTDLTGSVEQLGAPMQLFINTGGSDNMQQKAGISTSRSNVRSKSLAIIEADLDGDGEYESLRATATFSDGTSRDITAARQSGTKAIVLDGEVFETNSSASKPGNSRLKSVSIATNQGKLRATGTFSDGSTRDITENIDIVSSHNSVRQYNMTVVDNDDDGAVDAVVKTKTKSNQSNDRLAGGDSDDDGVSAIKMINVAAGDLDGDGAEDVVAGNMPTEFAILRERKGGYFENGDIPTQQRPGNPIGGLTIKGGKNPGGNLRTVQTDGNGDFEFTDLEAGNYTFTVEQKIFIEDQTYVSTRAQDHNSSRSNKTASSIAPDPGNDNDDVNTKVQDHNSSRSNKSSGSITPDPNEDSKNRIRASIKSMLSSLDELDEQLDNDASTNRTTINTTRSNIRKQRNALYELSATLDQQGGDMSKAAASVNRQFSVLYDTVKTISAQYTSVSNVLKTKHDTVKNSIGNIR